MKPALSIVLFLMSLPACGPRSEGEATATVPVIAIGETDCALCGMTIQNAHFAAARRDAKQGLLSFDSIECLIQDLRESGAAATEAVWLPDLSAGQLHPASEMTVVEADFPSPMGGGIAAFLDGELAQRLAAERGGRAASLAEIVRGGTKDGGS